MHSPNRRTRKVLLQHLKAWAPFLFLFIAMFIIHLVITKSGSGDDSWYRTQPSNGSYLEYVGVRYERWSARVLIELVVILFAKLPFVVWQIFDTIIMVIIALELSNLINRKKKLSLDWLIVLSVLLFPLSSMGTAGWIATSVGYTWALAAGLMGLNIMQNLARKTKKPTVLNISLMCLLMLFATDSEQLAAMIVGGFSIKIIYDFISKKKKPHFAIWLIFAIAIAKLIFILTCPGNHIRSVEEIRHFVTYPDFSLINKLYLGLLYTARIMFQFPFIPMLLIASLCILSHIRKDTTIFEKIIADLITFGSFVCLFGHTWVFPFSEKIAAVRKQLFTNFSDPNLNYSISTILIIFALFFGLCYLIFTNFRKNRAFVDLYIILLAGIGSQFMMCFSPTIYASSTRTATFMLFNFLIIQIIVNRQILLLNSRQAEFLIFMNASSMLLSLPSK